MATSVIVISDLSGESGATTRQVRVGPTTYEVDMTDAEFAEYEAAMARYIQVGRRVPTERSTVHAPRTTRHLTADTALIKAWGRQNGYTVPSRGRLPKALIDAYEAAH